MPFESFRRQRAPLTTEPAITIQKRGNFSLNPVAYAVLGEPKAVELLYDRERMLIALRKAPEDSEYAYLVRPLAAQRQRATGNTSWLVSGMAFTAYYGINTEIARRWTCRLEADGLLVLDLNEPGVEVTSNRDKANGTVSQKHLPGPTGVANGRHKTSPDEPRYAPEGRGSVS